MNPIGPARSLDSLVLEAFTWTPHLETAGEIAVTGAIAGKRTAFAFLHGPNPDQPDPLFTSVARPWGRRHKARQIERLLGEQGVEIIVEPALSARAVREARDYAARMPANLDALKHHDYGSAALGVGVASSLISITGDPNPAPSRYHPLSTALCLTAATAFETARALIEALEPRTVFTFNGRFAAARGIAEAARLAGVPITFHERGASPDRYELFSSPPQNVQFIQREVTRYWTTGGLDRTDVAERFFRAQREGRQIGWPSFIANQESGRLPPLPPDKRHIVYYTSSDEELEFATEISRDRPYPTQQEATLALMRWASERPSILLTIRVHPILDPRHSLARNWWHARAGLNTQIVPAESQVDSYALMDRADVVLSFGSTTGIEATFWGRPSILLANSEYGALDCAYRPHTAQELEALLDDPTLPALPRAQCLPYGYYLSVFGTPYRHYRPETFFSGAFLGTTLDDVPSSVRRAARSRPGRVLRRLLRRLLPR